MWRLLGSIDGKVRGALFALISVLVGAKAYVDWSWPDRDSPERWPWIIAAMAAAAIAGFLLSHYGGALVRRHPLAGLLMVEMRILWVLAVSGFLVLLGLWGADALAPGAEASGVQKASQDTIEKAVAALLGALTVAFVGEGATSATARAVKTAFQSAFLTYHDTHIADPGQAVFVEMLDQAVFSDDFVPPGATNLDGTAAEPASGWDWPNRWSRARTIAANLCR